MCLGYSQKKKKKVRQGEVFLKKVLKTEYGFVREEVGGERYHRLSCMEPGQWFCQVNEPGKRGRPRGLGC